MTNIKEALEKHPHIYEADAAALGDFCRQAGITEVKELADPTKVTLARMESVVGEEDARLAACAARPLLADENLHNVELTLKM